MMGLGKCIETASNVAAFWCIYVKFRGCICAKKTTPGVYDLSCQLQCLHSKLKLILYDQAGGALR